MDKINEIKKILLKDKKAVFKIKARTGQANNLITGVIADGTVKIDIAKIPEKGKANKELIAFLAKEFDVLKENVKIVSGASSKLKIIKIIR